MIMSLSFPAVNGEVVTQAHVNYCAENGHATHKIDGVDMGMCPRCGEVKITDARELELINDGMGFIPTEGAIMDHPAVAEVHRKLTAGAATLAAKIETEQSFYAERVEHYRAMGEDYGTATTWADMDARARYGS